MMSDRKLIKVIVSGFGCSGSSVVVDWLRETNCCHVFPGEWDLFRHPDGVQDLRSALTERVSLRRGYLAMRRFEHLCTVLARAHTTRFGRDYESLACEGFAEMMREFLQDLVAVRYPAARTAAWIENHHHSDTRGGRRGGRQDNGFEARLVRGSAHPSRFKSSLSKALLSLLSGPAPAQPEGMFQPLPLDAPGFDAIARRHFDRLAGRMTPRDRTHLVLDQAFYASGLTEGLDLMSDTRAVVVHRDPRDVLMSGINSDRDWIPTDSAESFARWFSIAMPSVDLDDPRIRVVAFEDVVLKSVEAMPMLLDFLGIDVTSHVDPGAHFDPVKSARNVGRWRQHADQDLVQRVWELTRPAYERIQSQSVQF